MNTQDYSGSERELRVALAQATAPEVEMSVRTVLAAVLAQEDKHEEATAISRPVCALSATGSARMQSLARSLSASKLCD
jgi:hypothetical protein